MNEPRKQMPAGASLLIMAFMLLGTLPLLYFMAAPKVELYLHGQVTEGTVLQVAQKEYRRKSSTYTAYEHTIEYAGHKRAFVKTYSYDKGAKVGIYYSTEDPDTAVFKEEGLPYTSFFDALLDPVILLLAAVNALFLAGFFFCAMLWLEERRTKERAL
ncbi:MAG: DUF3592 domain-containing protein [Alphaproteobacteria bacterium]|nr:MAG: DUF3592 domain-containing protein [Alphaproteobacteria bacterium]